MATSQAWYVNRDGKQVGPIDAAQLKHMASSGQLSPQDFVWKEGMAQWVQAQQVKGLFTAEAPGSGEARPFAATRIRPTGGAGSQGKAVGYIMTFAIAMLLTILLPWDVNPFGGSVVFSWTKIGALPAPFGVWLIGSWVVAIAALIVTPLTRGVARASVWAGMGALLAILMLVMLGEIGGGGGGDAALDILKAISLFIIIIFSHSRLHQGASNGMRVMQAIGAGVYILVAVIGFILEFTARGSTWKQYGGLISPWAVILRIEIVLEFLAVVGAAVFILLDGVMKRPNNRFTRTGLTMLYLALIIGYEIAVIGMSAGQKSWGPLRALNNIAIITMGMVLLLCNGLIHLTNHARKAIVARAAMAPAQAAAQPATQAAQQPAAQSAPEPKPAPDPKKETIEDKFAHLKKLKESGIITEEEFEQKRKRLVEEL